MMQPMQSQPPFQGGPPPFRPSGGGPPGQFTGMPGMSQPPRLMGGMTPGPPRPGMPHLGMMQQPPRMPQGPPSMTQGPPLGPPGAPPPRQLGPPPGGSHAGSAAGMPQLQQQMSNISLSRSFPEQGGTKPSLLSTLPTTNVSNGSIISSSDPHLTNGLSALSPAQHQQQQHPNSSGQSLTLPPMTTEAPMPPMSGGAPTLPISSGAHMPPMSTGAQIPPMSISNRPSAIPPMTNSTMSPMPGQNGPSMPGQVMSPMSRPGMLGQNASPMQGQNMPMSSQNMPPMSGQNMPAMPPRTMPSMPEQSMPPMPGHNIAPMSSQNMPSMPGQKMPHMPGQNRPPIPGQNIPPLPGLNMPSMLGQNMPPMTGKNMPPMPGQNMPPMPGQNMPPMPGQNMPPMPGQNMPSVQGHIMPPGASFNPSGAVQPPPMSGGPGMPPRPGAMPPPLGGAPAPGGGAYMGGAMGHRYPGAQFGSAQQQQHHPQQQHQQQQQQQQQHGGYSQQQSARRLNPDDMPSPLQVIEEDRRARTGEFQTALRGALPPLVTTKFVVRDGGNASPRFIRSTMYSVPSTPDMLKQTSVPFGLVVSPLAQQQPDEQPLFSGTSLAAGPVRCNRCKAYMSPLMRFMDGGRRFQCLLCHQMNETPPEYYCNMDSQGARADKFQRPELCLGTFEYIATPEYCREKQLPKEPAFIFVMEMSQLMVQRGLISLLCQNMSQLLQHLPRDTLGGETAPASTLKVGFITYDSSVHFYKLMGQAPEMCVICDKDEMFVPVPEGVLCDVNEAAENISKLMNNIPQIFQGTKENSGALGCAIQAGMSALKASGRTGKLFVFHSSLPQAEGPGKLKSREDRKLLGTDKEKSVLSPQSTYYNNLGQELVGVGCGVDLFLFNDTYVDLSTIGQVSRLTGGQVFKYTFFQREHDGARFLQDLQRNMSREVVFDAVMRVRTSAGVRPVDFYGHFFMANTQDMELACMDSAKAVAVEVKHDDKLTEDDGVYIQVALLYTSVGGQRRLRVINLSLNTCTQMAELYKNCDLDTLMNFFGKMAITKFLESTAKQVKEQFVSRTATILACYRKNCASPSAAGQLILPELLKLLPLYVNCLSRCEALSGGQDITCDERALHMYHLSSCTIEASIVYYYPRLIPLTDFEQDVEGALPMPVRTSYEKLRPDGAFLLENGLVMFLWVGSNTSAQWLQDVFGVNAPHQLDPTLSDLPNNDNDNSKRVREILAQVRASSQYHLRLFVVPQQGKHEVVLRSYLVEDKGVYGAPSYVDFLCHIHKEIRSLMQ